MGDGTTKMKYCIIHTVGKDLRSVVDDITSPDRVPLVVLVPVFNNYLPHGSGSIPYQTYHSVIFKI